MAAGARPERRSRRRDQAASAFLQVGTISVRDAQRRLFEVEDRVLRRRRAGSQFAQLEKRIKGAQDLVKIVFDELQLSRGRTHGGEPFAQTLKAQPHPGHRGSEIVRDIGRDLPHLIDQEADPIEHGVEGDAQLVKIVVAHAPSGGYAPLQSPVLDLARHRAQRIQLSPDPQAEDGGGGHANSHAAGAAQEKHPRQRLGLLDARREILSHRQPRTVGEALGEDEERPARRVIGARHPVQRRPAAFFQRRKRTCQMVSGGGREAIGEASPQPGALSDGVGKMTRTVMKLLFLQRPDFAPDVLAHRRGLQPIHSEADHHARQPEGGDDDQRLNDR